MDRNAVLACADRHAEGIAAPVRVDAGRDEYMHRHHFANLEHQGVGCDERERPGLFEPSGAEPFASSRVPTQLSR